MSKQNLIIFMQTMCDMSRKLFFLIRGLFNKYPTVKRYLIIFLCDFHFLNCSLDDDAIGSWLLPSAHLNIIFYYIYKNHKSMCHFIYKLGFV